MNQIYRAGIYCRLSVDDASNTSKAKPYTPVDESVSIENQRELLSKIVMLNGWVETKTYIDDGYSGGNFNRPGFQEMLKDARNGVINLILVKDLSRLGRDFVEVGRYTTDIFPALGVRFVSVLDCLDTDGDNTETLHIRSLMNDYHLRDLSEKIKSALYSKKINGQFACPMAPYGYLKSEDNRGLVIDENAAAVVRRMFEMRKSGESYSKIAAMLNQESVPSPRLYWYQINHKDHVKARQLWSYSMVKRILNNEVYRGALILNHHGTRGYKDRTRIRKSESEWIRHEAAHEAIITPETWNAVQEKNQEAKRNYHGCEASVKLFSGKLICADCKHTLIANTETDRQKNGTVRKYVYYLCGLHKNSCGAFCTRHTIYEKTLARIVAEEIRTLARTVTPDETAAVRKLLRGLSKNDAEYLSDLRQESARLQRRLGELESVMAKLYEDKINGVVSAEMFAVLMRKNEQERQTGQERLEAILPEINGAEQDAASVREWTAKIRKYLDLRELDREIIDELIDHIEISERTVIDGERRQEIKIFYRFVGLVDGE